jgi:hypothetical protein
MRIDPLREPPCSLEVWESPQTQVIPGRVNACSGPMMWTMPRNIHQNEESEGESVRSTLTAIGHAEIRQAKLLDIVLKSLALRARVWLCDERLNVGICFARGRPSVLQLARSSVEVADSCRVRDVMIHSCKSAIRSAHRAARSATSQPISAQHARCNVERTVPRKLVG